jgi:hypothetical protein
MLGGLEWPRRVRSAGGRRPNRYAQGYCIGLLTCLGIGCACAADAAPTGCSGESERTAVHIPRSRRRERPPSLSPWQRRRRRSPKLQRTRPARARSTSRRPRDITPALAAAPRTTEGRAAAGGSAVEAAPPCCAAASATTAFLFPAIKGSLAAGPIRSSRAQVNCDKTHPSLFPKLPL